jgi:hypothetical protein
VILAVGIVAGRHEGRTENARQLAGIDAVRAAVGSLNSKALDAWRDDGLLACLDYASGQVPYALQLCFDRGGRLLEAVDRRGPQPVYWSVAYRPALAHLSVGPNGFADIAHLAGVPKSRLGR